MTDALLILYTLILTNRLQLYMESGLFLCVDFHWLVIHFFDVQTASSPFVKRIAPKPYGLDAVIAAHILLCRPPFCLLLRFYLPVYLRSQAFSLYRTFLSALPLHLHYNCTPGTYQILGFYGLSCLLCIAQKVLCIFNKSIFLCHHAAPPWPCHIYYSHQNNRNTYQNPNSTKCRRFCFFRNNPHAVS